MTPAEELELRCDLARARTFLWRAMDALAATGQRPDLVREYDVRFGRRPILRARPRLRVVKP